MNSAFRSEKVRAVLRRLHSQSEEADRSFHEKVAKLPPEMVKSASADYRSFYGFAERAHLAIDEESGRLLYMLLRSAQARTVVEFGTSFGISTLYLAAAVRDNGGGKVVTCELFPSKAEHARKNLEEAGLYEELVEIRTGDALESLAGGVGREIDAVLLDGAKQLYLPILKLLEPSLRPGALIAADNMEHLTVAEFADYIRDPKNGYESANLPLREGDSFEIAVRI
ncbi:MAG TPA: class I SAM-dependent methyltransferase [Candidatus Methylacidiphilales bacterium]